MPISRCVGKTTMGHSHNGTLLGLKKEKVLGEKTQNMFATAWMGLKNIMLSEISQSEKHKYHTISLM